MTIDIKAIRAAAESTPNPWPMSLQPNTVLALCDEIDNLRNGMYNIANQSTEPAIKQFALSYLGDKT